MKIKCVDTGKRFNRDWIFRHFNIEFSKGGCYAITGPNGSGKSTLLQIIAGAMLMSEGSLEYYPEDALLPMEADKIYRQVSIAAPYLDLIEEMNLLEFLEFHEVFKPYLPGVNPHHIIKTIGLQEASSKQIRYYSSGMKQRVKLAQAIFSDTPCLLLDEPCSNLDDKGISLYHDLISTYGKNRLIIVSSNDEQEYSFCTERLNILDYKTSARQP